jgi:predicted phage terminase large subunit-like protein
LAATDPEEGKDPDYTAGVKLTQIGGRNVVEDVLRFRAKSTEVASTMRKVAELDGPGVTISIPQDPGQAGKAQVAYLTSVLAGFKVVAVRPTGSKETRAEPIASQVSGYNVDIVRAPWNAAFLEELANFPHGDHDDQVDGLSDAFNAMTGAAAGRASVQSIY